MQKRPHKIHFLWRKLGVLPLISVMLKTEFSLIESRWDKFFTESLCCMYLNVHLTLDYKFFEEKISSLSATCDPVQRFLCGCHNQWTLDIKLLSPHIIMQMCLDIAWLSWDFYFFNFLFGQILDNIKNSTWCWYILLCTTCPKVCIFCVSIMITIIAINYIEIMTLVRK